MVRFLELVILALVLGLIGTGEGLAGGGEQPLSRIGIHRATLAIHDSAYVKASPLILGLKGQTSEWVTLEYSHPNASNDDWIGVFSPAKFSASICEAENVREEPPLLCTAPIKYQLANYGNDDYNKTGKGTLKLQLINQREDFSFAVFSNGLSNPKLVAVSNTVKFLNPKAPVYPRLAQGKYWNEMTVTWTSGYNIDEAVPFVEWGIEGETQMRSPAVTLTFSRESMCGSPARTVGWRDPGFIHTSFLKDTWPNSVYTYKLGHKLLDGSYVWSRMYSFRGSPYPGQESLQRVVIFGDMGKAEADGSNEFNNFQPGSLNTTYQIIKDLNNIDFVLHNGDICYANGYISQWDQFTAQVEAIASTVPYMIGSGNHERDWPGTGSFYGNLDSGGECGVLAESMFYVPELQPILNALGRQSPGSCTVARRFYALKIAEVKRTFDTFCQPQHHTRPILNASSRRPLRQNLPKQRNNLISAKSSNHPSTTLNPLLHEIPNSWIEILCKSEETQS